MKNHKTKGTLLKKSEYVCCPGAGPGPIVFGTPPARQHEKAPG